MFTWSYFSESSAQPSGGPYGPLDKTYNIPETSHNIYYVSPDGNEEFDGKKLNTATSVESAIAQARTGDVIILRGGLYRTGNLIFNQGIILQPYLDEKPVFKGTEVATNWEKVSEGLWTTSWKNLFPAKPESWWRPNPQTPLHRFNDDMVFVDGRFLQSAGNKEEVDTSTFFIDYEQGKVYIGTNPEDKLVEITAFNVLMHRVYKKHNGIPPDGIGPIIRGIEISQYADTAILIEGTYPEGLTDEKEYGNDAIGTVLENCEISWCSRIGVYVMGDSLLIRNCKVTNTSTEGIYLIGASDAVIENTIISRNNIENISGYFPAGVKIFNQCYRVTCRNNLVTDQSNSNGIWYDVGNVDGVFINNWIEQVGNVDEEKYSTNKYRSGFFFEISKGAIVAGNVFLDCDNGSFVLNSSNVKFFNNTYINSKVAFRRTERSAANDHFGWHPATGPDIDERTGHIFMNNLIVQDKIKNDPLLEVSQSQPMCEVLNSPQLKSLDYNIYVNRYKRGTPAIIWTDLGKEDCELKLEDTREISDLNPRFEKNTIFLTDFKKPVFNNEDSLDFRLDSNFSKRVKGKTLAKDISLLLGTKDKVSYIGAYPE